MTEKRIQNIRDWLQSKHVGQVFQPAIYWPELRSFTKEDLRAISQYRRRLPHWELEGSTYFVTFRVHNALGKPLLDMQGSNRLEQSRLRSGIKNSKSLESGKLENGRLESLPHIAGLPLTAQPPPTPASIVEEALWFGYEERYVLDAYVIMPDHVHLLLRPLPGWTLGKILQSLKGFTAKESNRLLGRKGPFWQDERFDHLVRNDGDWLDKFEYIHNNPVSAGLVEKPQDYPFSSLVTMHSKGRLEIAVWSR
jgi:REP element-mobilizing transposase RayT